LKTFLTQVGSALTLTPDPPVRLHDDQKGGTTIEITIWGAFLSHVLYHLGPPPARKRVIEKTIYTTGCMLHSMETCACTRPTLLVGTTPPVACHTTPSRHLPRRCASLPTPPRLSIDLASCRAPSPHCVASEAVVIELEL
jgi:hypothetical protein